MPVKKTTYGKTGATVRTVRTVSRKERHRQLDEPQIARVLMTVEQAAQALSMCRYTVNKLIASGELQSIKIGRMRRVPTAALDEFVQRRVQSRVGGSSVA